ncbi:LCP family protein [Arthrobacter rhizosphaerae]|uniref:LCP family protein n=1 Tax=Arthrobacter rhizosphaerae TaxID=2855490 RepID=UPI001FF30872|nr:LCP family protein [Arthrobacter rhizosphaerae]
MTEESHDPQPARGGTNPANMQGRPQLFLALAISFVLVLGVISAALYFNRQPTASPGPSPTVTSTPTETPTPTPTPAPAPPPPPPPPPEPPPVAMNILLIGSDIRGDARAAEAERGFTGQRADHRADVLMLVHVPADRQHIYGISLMRDLWVDIPGYGGSKINASLEIGGVPLVHHTVSTLLNSPIDRTIMVDFDGIKHIAEILGGVEVNVPIPFTSTHDARDHFPAGINKLYGSQLLQFLRERYAFSDGDYQRVRNQQTFLRSLLAQALNYSWLAEPNKARDMVVAVAPHVTLDPSADLAELGRLAYSLRGTRPENTIFFTLPTAGTGFSADGQSIVLQNPAATAAVGAALSEGRIGEYIAANGLSAGN